MTLIEAMDMWLAEVATKGTKTIDLYTVTRNLAALYFGKGEKLDVAPAQITKFMAWLRDVRQNSNNTIRGRLKHLGIFFSWAIAQGYVEKNPVKLVAAPAPEKKEVQAIPEEWMAQVMAYLKGAWQTGDLEALRGLVYLGLLYGTGMRRGGLLSASWKDFKQKAATLTITEKGLKTYTVHLSPALAELLAIYKTATSGKPSQAIINLTGDGVRKNMKALFAKAGLPEGEYRISPHTLRHSFAIKQLLSGNDLKTVSQALHHTRIATTAEFYTNLTESQVWGKVLAHDTLAGVI